MYDRLTERQSDTTAITQALRLEEKWAGRGKIIARLDRPGKQKAEIEKRAGKGVSTTEIRKVINILMGANRVRTIIRI